MKRFGVVYGWGSNKEGQLTYEMENTRQTLPTEITKFKTVTNIDASFRKSFVVKDTESFAAGKKCEIP